METVSLQLELKRDTGRYLVASREGREFWFDKEVELDWEVQDMQLLITTSAKRWERRLKNASQNALLDAPLPEMKIRKCLCCKTEFQAEKNQYICRPCKSTALWGMGYTVFTN